MATFSSPSNLKRAALLERRLGDEVPIKVAVSALGPWTEQPTKMLTRAIGVVVRLSDIGAENGAPVKI